MANARRSKLSAFLVILLALVIAGGVFYMIGPRTVVDTTLRFDRSKIGDDVEAYLKTSEAQWGDLRPGAEKQIVWADPVSKAKTPYVLVYLHGFSASAGEVRPLPDLVAKSLGANLFFTRFAGHGRSNDAMGEATVNDWVNDYAEAIAIAEKLGDRIILMSTSTGGTIATWGLANPDLTQNVAATIFISPNYGVQGFGASLLTGPWSKQLAELLIGKRRSFVPKNDLHKAFSTYEYPTTALLPMAAFTKLAVNAPVDTYKVPALFLISSLDKVVRPELTRAIEAKWGGPHQLVDVGDVEDDYDHVIAGDALSPSNTQPMAETMLSWLKSTLQP
jgi:pimeloyl-ACP methyl ester carboxylesterase